MHLRSNIILDFMDPENRILYGSYKNLSETEHVRLLKEGLNLAKELLMENAVSEESAEMAIQNLQDLEESMHGAMLIDKDTGERIDGKGIKGECSYTSGKLYPQGWR